ncbi:hypothetical protein H4S07_006953 [Coemansia furcata]|uniref:Uncharacterized protein n=1 Tax=Coemansia furcata TaxID=417177 RepID=A0ACC1KRJ4_9FUNG|nr:hypothetical protein H4S07_006953 [Coemansia furcata]
MDAEDGAGDKKRKRDDEMNSDGNDLPNKVSKMDPSQETIATAVLDGLSIDEQTVTVPAPSPPPPVELKETNGSEPLNLPAQSPPLNMYHTAAYDAFMTGYIFASYRLVLEDKMNDYKNKVYIMGLDSPLLIQAGLYANTSITYRQTMRLMNTAAADAAVAAEAAEPFTVDADQQQNNSKPKA